jgi:hypothetical protein
MGKNYSVRVVSSDSLIQLSASGLRRAAADRAREFKTEVDHGC